MSTTANLLDKYLRALHNTSDPVYKSLVSDIDGVPEITINDPMDFNNGAIAGCLEWIRQLSIGLLKQICLSTAEGKYLDYMVHNHINLVKFQNETDTAYRERVRNYIIAPKISRASIIYYSRPFSSPGEPQILDGVDDAAFADVSFSDVYTSFQNQGLGLENNYWVFPALTTSISGSAYFFVLRLENTVSSDIVKVVDLIDRWIAAGIAYEIQIVAV